eukprot:jgi/Chrzof1/13454/Cz07g33230.t1
MVCGYNSCTCMINTHRMVLNSRDYFKNGSLPPLLQCFKDKYEQLHKQQQELQQEQPPCNNDASTHTNAQAHTVAAHPNQRSTSPRHRTKATATADQQNTPEGLLLADAALELSSYAALRY